MAMMQYSSADSAKRSARVVNALRLTMIVSLLCVSVVLGFPLQNLSGTYPSTRIMILKDSMTQHRPTTSKGAAMPSTKQELATPPSTSCATLPSRRDALSAFTMIVLGTLTMVGSSPPPAFAVPDCFQDCVKNCKKIAPKDPDYCLTSCQEYCEQEDRTDGLSGSVSAESGEVGLLGGTFGQGTVPKGEDRVGVI